MTARSEIDGRSIVYRPPALGVEAGWLYEDTGEAAPTPTEVSSPLEFLGEELRIAKEDLAVTNILIANLEAAIEALVVNEATA